MNVAKVTKLVKVLGWTMRWLRSFGRAADSDSPELFSVASRHSDRSVHQFKTQYCCHLHRHQVFRLAQVRSDEDLKMSIFVALIIPALADISAGSAAGGKSYRDTKLRRLRRIQSCEHGRYALSDMVQPGFARLM